MAEVWEPVEGTAEQLAETDMKLNISVTKPNLLVEAIKVLDELDSLLISPQLLKENPMIVQTLKKLVRYIGPKVCSDETEEQKVTK